MNQVNVHSLNRSEAQFSNSLWQTFALAPGIRTLSVSDQSHPQIALVV